MLNSQQVISKSYEELSKEELYEILSLRIKVFCVEQSCPYQDIDFQDQKSQHVFIIQNQHICAYARIVPDENHKFHIGRVVVDQKYRGAKLASLIMKSCIGYCQDQQPNVCIEISAQSYLSGFYQALGFKNTGKYYLEDDIPHEQMLLTSV